MKVSKKAGAWWLLFVLAAVLMGWLAVERRRNTYLAIALLALSCAFFTKVATAYFFYAVAVIIVTHGPAHGGFYSPGHRSRCTCWRLQYQ